VFPLVPVILADGYYGICTWELFSDARFGGFGPEPRDWGWGVWIIMLGPLLGYGFLVGATVDVPDELGTPQRRLLRFLSRRSVWVGIGPWCGGPILFGVLLVFGNLFPAPGNQAMPEPWKGTWVESVLAWLFNGAFAVLLAYGWLWTAWAALRRAARVGRLRRAFCRGLSVALAFVGSLFGGFWAATSWWRAYFFDPRIVPLFVVAVGMALTSGCASTITYGEVRRRELFHAMLVAWVLGLALMWRWWSRRRPGPPDSATPA
jgi:hypothetical protein